MNDNLKRQARQAAGLTVPAIHQNAGKSTRLRLDVVVDEIKRFA